jgi:hypothetical protein
VLAFIRGTELRKCGIESVIYKNHDSFLSSEKALISSSKIAHAKEVDIHYLVKKKIKYRATTSENSILRAPYFTKFVHFTIFKNRLISGIPTIYQIQLHTYLHLYQLF